MKNFMNIKRLLSVFLAVAMLVSLASPAIAAESDGVSFTQVDNNRVAAQLPGREPVELPQEEELYDDDDIVRVSIFLEKAATIEAGYATFNIAGNNAAMRYRAGLNRDQETLTQKIEKAIGGDLDVVWNLTLATNLISANVEYGQIEAIKAIPGVRSVVIEMQYLPDVVSSGAASPNMATSGEQIGSAAAWAAGYTGAGTKIAIIDTGLDVDHEAFDADAYEYSLSLLDGTYDLMDAADIAAVLDQLNAYKRVDSLTADALYVNSKIPFGFNYVDKDLDIVHVNDGQGEHGSHVAGIATANAYVENADGTFSYALDTTFVQGVAPDAQLMVMKVFGKDGGAYDSDYMAAIEDAIILGADSVNLSLGSGNPGMSRATGSSEELGAYQEILDGLEKSGVTVVMSAGNSGYWSESAENGLPYLYLDDVSFQTNGSPGSYTNSLSVASVDNDGFTAAYFTVGNNIVTYNESTGYNNQPMTTIAGTHEYVLVNSIGTPENFAAVGADVLNGKIVMCYRGETSFFEKANAAAAMGAAGVVIVNNQDGIIMMDLTGYEYTVPCVSVNQVFGEVFKTAGTEHTTESGITYWTGSMEVGASLGGFQNNSEYYTMSSFSSWGVPGSLELKPEITAPGGSIYSVAGANTYQGELLFGDHASYEIMSGTSMAAPQVTGMVALLAQYIRETGLDTKTGLDERTLAQSLLMSTAVPLLDGNSGGNYYPVIQQGAGLANIGAATTADSYILMGSDATVTYNDGKVKAELGDDPDKTGVYSFSFTINNLTNVEKAFALSADVFTQDAFGYSGILLLDTWTTNLTPTISWTVNGKAVDNGEDLAGLDFNGDGVINSDDGQALLDYATGVRATLTNADKADMDADGDIDSYDSYLFLTLLNESGAVVPANGTATVDVTITLSGDDKQWLAYYENGAYIEAFVYAESLCSAEGVEGTTHSIPVLGFYGNWSDPSMFDKGSYVEFANGLENRPPYLYGSAYSQDSYNGLLITYADMAGEYWFGGNPMVNDSTYMPERNAISATRGDVLSTLGFTSIRNAADSYYQVVNTTTGEYLINEQTGNVPSAYYYVNGDTWRNTYYTLGIGFVPEGIAENTALEVGITLIPEYYVSSDGSIDWDALGHGVTFSMPMVVDNTAPVVDDVDVDTENNILVVTATDNQYIAAVALFDIYGEYVYTYTGSDAEQAAGDTVEFTLDLSEVNGPSFLLQVYDYAMNTTTYEIETQIGSVVETIEGIEISHTDLIMQRGTTAALSAVVYPVNASNRDVTWASSNPSVADVDQNGVVTAHGAGTVEITATSVADATVSATCYIEVIDIAVDMNAIVWDEEGSIWYSQFNTADLPNYEKLSQDLLDTDYFANACVGPDGTIYASSLNTSTGTGSLYTINPETLEVTFLSDCMVQGLHIFYSDLTYVPGMFGTGVLLGTYGPYVVAIDPATGTAIGIIDEFDEYLLGITTCYGAYDPDSGVYQDVVYLIQRDGTVIQEIYYGYDYMVVPYMYYFYGERAAMDSGVNVGDAWYFNSAYYDGNYLYWSAFDEETQNNVTLYAIDADVSGDVYNLGQFADSVWPVAGMHQNAFINDAAAAATKLEEVSAAMAGRELVQIQYVLEPIEVSAVVKGETEAPVAGGLNSTADYEPPMVPLSEAVEDSQGVVTLTVTAKDAEGNDVASTNGVSTVTYDPEQLKLVGIEVEGDYVSFSSEDVSDNDGSVTFGYVDLDGIAAGDTVATLYFEVKVDEEMNVTVEHEEVGNEKPGYDEVLEVGCAHDVTHVVGAEPADCTNPGYTGDTYCDLCDALLEEGEPIEATGHLHTHVVGAEPADCTNPGYTGDTYCSDCGALVENGDPIEATGHLHTHVVGAEPADCTNPGYTGDTYCTDCGALVENGEPIEATGHDYDSVVTPPSVDAEGYTTHTCSGCGDSYKDSYVPKLDPENPPTGDDFRMVPMMVLLTVSLLGMAVVTVNGKKWLKI